jgi:hypothetical protein
MTDLNVDEPAPVDYLFLVAPEGRLARSGERSSGSAGAHMFALTGLILLGVLLVIKGIVGLT